MPEIRFVHPTLQARIGRVFGLVTFSLFTLRQLLPRELGGQFPGWGDGLVLTRWLLITGLFALFLHAYLIRKPALELANRPLEALLPLLCAPLPLVVILVCQYYYGEPAFRAFLLDWLPGIGDWFILRGQSPAQIRGGLAVMALGEAVTVAGMCWLGGSFSIFTEARPLVRSGPYRWVRHPLYAGEILSLWGYVLVVANPFTVLGAASFTLLQILRARMEEKKLLKNHPEYRRLQQRTGFLLPRLWPQGNNR